MTSSSNSEHSDKRQNDKKSFYEECDFNLYKLSFLVGNTLNLFLSLLQSRKHFHSSSIDVVVTIIH